MLSIETIDGDEADELLRNLGKLGGEDVAGKKKKKKTKGDAEDKAAGDVQEHDSNPVKMKKKKTNTAEAADDCIESVQPVAGKKGKRVAARDAGGVADKTTEQGKKVLEKRRRTEAEAVSEGADEKASGVDGDSGEPTRKKKKTQKERKEEKKQRLAKQAEKQAFKAASRAAEMGSEDEHEEAVAGEVGDAEEDTLSLGRAADYDDGFEYEDWGGVMMRKCITKALLEKGFATPTPIQEAVLPAALAKRRDIFGAAETGSGKTLAFALPMLQVPPPRALRINMPPNGMGIAYSRISIAC